MEKKIEVVNNNGQLVVSSMQVAENFEKQHKHVLDAIENTKAKNSAVTLCSVKPRIRLVLARTIRCTL